MDKNRFSALNALITGYLIATGETPSSFFREEEKKNEESLGNGYTLGPIWLTEEESKSKEVSRMKYSYLYHNGLKVSDSIFRKGGSCIGFKDGYCNLIHYTRITKREKPSGFSTGDHVIINELGEIVLKGDGLDYPSHIGGHIGKFKGALYNLINGEKIAPMPRGSIKGKNCLIINHQYSFDDKGFPLGVYKIDLFTAKITRLDDTGE